MAKRFSLFGVAINAVEDLQYDTLVKLKKLLVTIASGAPFTPNITKLSERVGVSRNMPGLSNLMVLGSIGTILLSFL